MRADARQTNETYISRKAQREAIAFHDRLLAWLLNDPAIVKTAGIPHCITVPEMATILGISPRTAYERVRERRLPGIQHEPNGEVIVPIPMLIKFLAGEAWTTPAFEALVERPEPIPNGRRRVARRTSTR